MKVKPIIYLIGMALVSIMPGCTSDFDDPESGQNSDSFQDSEVTEVDINLSFESDWNIDPDETRAAPPGTGGNNDTDKKVNGDEDMEDVDKVRVIAFKRREGTDDHFIYDVRNDQILDIEKRDEPASDGKPEGHKHLTAHGKLQKIYGFEYRIIAVAYASTKTNLYDDIDTSDKCLFSMPDGEQNWFRINTDAEPTYEEVMASLNFETIPDNVNQTSWRDFFKYNGASYVLESSDPKSWEKNADPLSRNVIQVPQLFYGILHSKTGSEIIGYSETDENGDLTKELPVSGVLYRGVAKLIIKLKLSNKGMGSLSDPFKSYKWIALLADEVTTDVSLSSYDDFLKPIKKPNIKQGYTAVNYLKLGDDKNTYYNDGEYRTIETWFLPTRTRLALRVKGTYNTTDWINIKNFQILTTDAIYSEGNGTGIMSPDVVDGVFYLRRNHKYAILEIDVDRLMNSNHELK